MPYIDQNRRDAIDTGIVKVSTAGELNYKITTLALAYLSLKGTSYQTFNDIVGALEGAKLELYRRRIAEYENKKAKENGDVY